MSISRAAADTHGERASREAMAVMRRTVGRGLTRAERAKSVP